MAYLLDLTPYSGVNTVLERLLADARQALGEQFVGLYLYGSLAGGDFNPETSDIDFLVVTQDRLPDEMVHALEAMHTRLWASGLEWAKKLEGSYLPQAMLPRYDPADLTPWPTVNEGRFYLAPHGWDWVMQRYLLREHSAALAGPDLRPMIAEVTTDDLRRAVREMLKEWWAPMLVGGSKEAEFLDKDYYRVYTVLSMCRALHTLETGELGSKRVAAHWAMVRLGEPWRELIKEALAWREGSPFEHRQEVEYLIRLVAQI